MNPIYLVWWFIFFIGILFPDTVFAHPTDGQIIIHMDEEGFDQQTINVEKGDTVIFLNEGELNHWPASDYHPTHTKYPNSGIEKCGTSQQENILDACRGLKKDEEYKFTFNNAGKWSLHDHLFPAITMTVEVIDPKKTIKKKNNSFLKSIYGFIVKIGDIISDKMTIFGRDSTASGFLTKDEKGLIDVSSSKSFLIKSYSEQQKVIKDLSKKNPKEAWEYLKKAFIFNGQVIGNPHELAHIIGNNIYRQYGLEGIALCDKAFAFGCYHGVSEEMLLQLGRDAILDVELQCSKIFPDDTQDFTGCYHGMGHGLLTWEGMNLKNALEDCDMLNETHRSYCYDGVFMEYSFSATGFDTQNPWQICESLPSEYHFSCARYQGRVFMQNFDQNFTAASSVCFKTSNLKMQEFCVFSLGQLVAQRSLGDINGIKNTCSGFEKEEGKHMCRISAAQEVIFQQYSNWEKVSSELCEKLPGNWKNRCFDSLEMVKKQSLSDKNPIEEIAVKTMEACKSTNRSLTDNKERCYSKKFEDIAFNNGSDYAFEVLHQLQKLDKDARACHFIGHGIGYGTYKRSPTAWHLYVNSINPGCTYGGVHGILEQYVGTLPEGGFTKDLLPTFCGDTPRADCNHIIGHLVLVEKKGDINMSLDMCSAFKDDYQRRFCLTGVYMEHQTALNLIAHGYAPNSWLNWAARVDDLERLCRSYSEENATSCWEEITHAALVKFNYEPEKIFDFCNSAQLEQGAEACKRHAIGIMASEKNYDLQLLKNICTVKQPPNDPEFESDCYGLLVSNKLYSIPPKDAKDTVFFCSSIKPEFRSTCFNYLGAALAAQTSSIEEIEEICSTAPTDFKFQCNRKSRQKTEVQTKK